MNWLKRYINKTVVFSVLLFSIVSASHVYAINSLDGVRVWPAPENTRVVFDLKNKPEYSYFVLSNPQRLVIDFKKTKSALSLNNISNNDNRVKKIRTSTAKIKSSTRLVLELTDKYNLTLKPHFFLLVQFFLQLKSWRSHSLLFVIYWRCCSQPSSYFSQYFT